VREFRREKKEGAMGRKDAPETDFGEAVPEPEREEDHEEAVSELYKE
jgi:hypothetical protein